MRIERFEQELPITNCSDILIALRTSDPMNTVLHCTNTQQRLFSLVASAWRGGAQVEDWNRLQGTNLDFQPRTTLDLSRLPTVQQKVQSICYV